MEKDDLKIAITKIKELEYSYQEPTVDLQKKFNKDLMRIGVKLHFDPREKEEIFGVVVTIVYEYKQSQQLLQIMKFRNLTEFHILNLSKVLKRLSDGKFHMPDNLMGTLVGVAIANARGMIAGKTAGSFIGQFHLPIINPTELLKNYTIATELPKAKVALPTKRVIAKPSRAKIAVAKKG